MGAFLLARVLFQIITVCSQSLKNSYEDVQILTELKLNPCTGIFKDFVQNCKAATLQKQLSLVNSVLFSRAFFTSLIKICQKSEA